MPAFLHRTMATPEPTAPTGPIASSAATAAEPGVVHGCVGSGLIPTPENITKVVAATLCLINNHRHANGLASVHTNSRLKKAAAEFSAEMVSENFFSHTDPSGHGLLDRLTAAGYVKPGQGYSIAENIAAGGGTDATPEAIVAMWMASPDHRANILNPAYRDSGIGVVAAMPACVGSGPGATYTQDFG
jgi:uncharacterized protein YkwD